MPKTRKQWTETITENLSKVHEIGKRTGKSYTWRDVAEKLYPNRDINSTAALINKIYRNPKYTPGTEICRELGIYEPVLTDPCIHCGEVHTLGEICPLETPVDIIAYQISSEQLEELKNSNATVNIIYKKKRKVVTKRKRYRVETAPPINGEWELIKKLTPEQRLEALKKFAEDMFA